MGEQVTVSTAQSGASCGFQFTKGERYIVYAGEEKAGDGGGTAKLQSASAAGPHSFLVRRRT